MKKLLITIAIAIVGASSHAQWIVYDPTVNIDPASIDPRCGTFQVWWDCFFTGDAADVDDAATAFEGIARAHGGIPSADGAPNPMAFIDEAGFSSTIATNSEFEMERYPRLGRVAYLDTDSGKYL